MEINKKKYKYLNAQDIVELTGKEESWAYKKMRQLNEELKEDGYLICRGRIPANYFYKRMGFNIDLEDSNEHHQS